MLILGVIFIYDVRKERERVRKIQGYFADSCEWLLERGFAPLHVVVMLEEKIIENS